MPRFRGFSFYQNRLKIWLFYKKIHFRKLGAPPPAVRGCALRPQAGFARRPPTASGGWGLRFRPPKEPSLIADFWLRAYNEEIKQLPDISFNNRRQNATSWISLWLS